MNFMQTLYENQTLFIFSNKRKEKVTDSLSTQFLQSGLKVKNIFVSQ